MSKASIFTAIETGQPLPGVKNVFPSVYPKIGPFVFIDHIGPMDIEAGKTHYVPPHPHAGIETISYMFEGEGYHKDSLGYVQVLEVERVNWMTSGKGIVHSERISNPIKDKAGIIHGLQIWTYIPVEYQSKDPYFQTYAHDQLPCFTFGNGSSFTLVAGNYNELHSPVKLVRELIYAAVKIKEADKFTLDLNQNHENAIYVCKGTISIEGQIVNANQLYVINDESLNQLKITAQNDAIFIFLAGAPVNESMYFHGPFILDSKQAIIEAFSRYKSGEMGILHD
jgi:redox-sensitive bicupin YhaK (pirin superfamily)